MDPAKLITPIVVMDEYRRWVEHHEPNDVPHSGPPPMLMILDEAGTVFHGPIFGDWTDPDEALQHLHPAMLPKGPRIIQVAFAVEAEGTYGHPDKDEARYTDIVLTYAAAHPDLLGGTWRAFNPFTRFVNDGTPEVVWCVADDPVTPPMWHVLDGHDISDEPCLVAMRRLATSNWLDPLDPDVSIARVDKRDGGETVVEWITPPQ